MTKRTSLLKNFYPKYTFEKVEDIPYELIKRDGIKLILMDMDTRNTMAIAHIMFPVINDGRRYRKSNKPMRLYAHNCFF